MFLVLHHLIISILNIIFYGVLVCMPISGSFAQPDFDRWLIYRMFLYASAVPVCTGTVRSAYLGDKTKYWQNIILFLKPMLILFAFTVLCYFYRRHQWQKAHIVAKHWTWYILVLLHSTQNAICGESHRSMTHILLTYHDILTSYLCSWY